MADRITDESDDEFEDRRRASGSSRGRSGKRRIRVTQNGMPDRPTVARRDAYRSEVRDDHTQAERHHGASSTHRSDYSTSESISATTAHGYDDYLDDDYVDDLVDDELIDDETLGDTTLDGPLFDDGIRNDIGYNSTERTRDDGVRRRRSTNRRTVETRSSAPTGQYGPTQQYDDGYIGDTISRSSASLSSQSSSYPRPSGDSRYDDYSSERGEPRSRFPHLSVKTLSSRRGTSDLPAHGGISDVVGRGRVAMGILMGLLAFIGYSVSKEERVGDFDHTQPRSSLDATQSTARIKLHVDHDIGFGRWSADDIASRHGGITGNQPLRSRVQQIGRYLAKGKSASQLPFPFEFDVLGDGYQIDSCAVPGGRTFVTERLVSELTSEGEVAAVLALEMAHITNRHCIRKLKEATLTSGNHGDVVLASFVDPDNYRRSEQDVVDLTEMAATIHYDDHEIAQSDLRAVTFLADSGYDPNSLLTALRRLDQVDGHLTRFAMRQTSSPDREARIKQEIGRKFPNGVPVDYIE